MHSQPFEGLWTGFGPDGREYPHQPPDFGPFALWKYSQELRDTVMACLEVHPITRPSLQELRAKVLKYTGAAAPGEEQKLSGLRDAPDDDHRFHEHRPPIKDAKYALGCAVRHVIPGELVRTTPALDSPVQDHIGGPMGVLAPFSELQRDAETYYKHPELLVKKRKSEDDSEGESPKKRPKKRTPQAGKGA